MTLRLELGGRFQRTALCEANGGECAGGRGAGNRQPPGSDVRRCRAEHRCGVHRVDRGAQLQALAGRPPSREEGLYQLPGAEDTRDLDHTRVDRFPREQPKQGTGTEQQRSAPTSLGNHQPGRAREDGRVRSADHITRRDAERTA
jgi:hypothetical protein